MGRHRVPGPIGADGATENVRDGTLNLQATAAPIPLGAPVKAPALMPVVICEKGHTEFTPNWKSKDGDTNFQDKQLYNALNADQQKRVDGCLSKSDEDLKKIFRDFIIGSLSTGKLGGDMVDRFYGGSQEAMRHAKGSVLSEMARNSSSLRSHAAMVRDKIGELLPRPAGSYADYTFLANKIDVPTVNFGTTLEAVSAWATFQADEELTLKALIGGTQGLRLTLQRISYSRNHTRDYSQFSVELRYEIFDNFGVGNNDIYTSFIGKLEDYHDALVAFWVLQHMRNGHKPFVNFIELETIAIGGNL